MTGEYRIIELRPGTYTVTFTLPGFNTFKRDGLELRRISPRRSTPCSRSGHSGNRDRLGHHAARRHAERDAAADILERAARRRADGEEHARHRRADAVGGRAAERAGRRRQQGRAIGPPVGARQQDLRFAAAAGRHALQRADPGHRAADAPRPCSSVARRHGTRLLHQPACRAGDAHRYRLAGLGAVPVWRRAGEHDSERRRQQVLGFAVLRRHRQRTPEQQSHRRSAEPGPDVGELRPEGVRLQRRVRRPNRQGSYLVLRVGAPLGHDDGCGESVCRRQHLGSRDRRAGRRVAVRTGPQQPDLPGGNRPGGRHPLHREAERRRTSSRSRTTGRGTSRISSPASSRPARSRTRRTPATVSSQTVLQGDLDPAAVDETPARRGRDRQPVQLRRIRRRPLPERLRVVRRRPGQQRLDQRHRASATPTTASATGTWPCRIRSTADSTSPTDRRSQRQDRRVLDVWAQRRAWHLHRPVARAGQRSAGVV